MSTDWHEWHLAYDDPESALSRRLRAVQARVREGLALSAGARVVSICAGQGRDLIEVLAERPGAAGQVRLVELDERNAAAAGAAARAARVELEVLRADAGLSDSYIGATPADLVVAAGVFGNTTDSAVERTVRLLPTLCAPGATVIWTRHRREPDLTPRIREWFTEAGFAEHAFDAPSGDHFSVGVHRLIVAPSALIPGTRLFEFSR
ncbi:hypothetical protein EV193_103347 [Herbihabitans rhizosphaerae]|uniref:Methyltransferase n=1 Tax=Herbihabitans rhizosphaerae TaxID=1872711 RepID=A0A4Q7KVI3_9PSEU|nr:SAM-dependent methyltransferase [Herbihabitans rhizosphaerae]RZS41029.1 hypothetical protein EV193_103347 [Herbihabitans rhizosphaerae]